MSLQRIAVTLLIIAISPTIAIAWSAIGHHVAAVIAYDSMTPEARQAVMDVLRTHPQFEKHFKPPRGVTGPVAIERWQLGVAGCWPDIIRGTDYDRPTWHYQLGASVVIGDVKPHDAPSAARTK